MTVTQSRFETQTNQLYETPPWVTRAVLRHIDVKGSTVWEPAAGRHKMVREIEAHGATVIATDRYTYDGVEHDAQFHYLGTGAWATTPVIHDHHISNPPYGPQNNDATRWATFAMERTNGWIALLLTCKFDSGKGRTHLFRDNPRFHAKIVLMDRIQWFPGEFGNTEDHAWFVFRPSDHPSAPPTLIYEVNDGMDGDGTL